MQRRYSLKALAAMATLAGLSALPVHAQDVLGLLVYLHYGLAVLDHVSEVTYKVHLAHHLIYGFSYLLAFKVCYG